MHQEALAEKAVVQEMDKLFAFAGKVKKITQGKRCVVCIGRMLMYFHRPGFGNIKQIRDAGGSDYFV